MLKYLLLIGEMIMTIYLVRHGKDDDTRRGGWSNHGLLPAGVEQARALAREIVLADLKIDRIYSSDLQRAAETAEILAEYLRRSVEYVREFREVDNGVLRGMKNTLADKQYPGLYWSALDYDERYPDGESPEMFYTRIQTAWSELKNKQLERGGGDALLVTHGGVIEAILCIESKITFSNKAKRFFTPHASLVPVKIR